MTYRIRVGKKQFADAHYLTKFNKFGAPNYTSIYINKKPLECKRYSTAQKWLEEAITWFTYADIEEVERWKHM